jgi:hypothetical protein
MSTDDVVAVLKYVTGNGYPRRENFRRRIGRGNSNTKSNQRECEARMSVIPVVASVDEIPEAIEFADTRPSARWYVSRRALALGSLKPSRPPGVRRSSLACAQTLARQPVASDQDRLVDLAQLSDDLLTDLLAEITQAFSDADAADDLDEMKAAAEAKEHIEAEQDRRSRGAAEDAETADTGLPRQFGALPGVRSCDA